MPLRPRQLRSRRDEPLTAQAELELLLGPYSANLKPGERDHLANLWRRHGAALIERDGADRWAMSVRAFASPPGGPKRQSHTN